MSVGEYSKTRLFSGRDRHGVYLEHATSEHDLNRNKYYVTKRRLSFTACVIRYSSDYHCDVIDIDGNLANAEGNNCDSLESNNKKTRIRERIYGRLAYVEGMVDLSTQIAKLSDLNNESVISKFSFDILPVEDKGDCACQISKQEFSLDDTELNLRFNIERNSFDAIRTKIQNNSIDSLEVEANFRFLYGQTDNESLDFQMLFDNSVVQCKEDEQFVVPQTQVDEFSIYTAKQKLFERTYTMHAYLDSGFVVGQYWFNEEEEKENKQVTIDTQSLEKIVNRLEATMRETNSKRVGDLLGIIWLTLVVLIIILTV